MKLYTAATPNGWKASIMLEELVEEGKLSSADFEVIQINLLEGEQFSEQFKSINPNSRIPALDDREAKLMESCAILQYLAEKYESQLLPTESRWQIIPWLYWQAANLGPAFGNKLSYTRYMPDVPDIEKQHPLKRFNTEANRLVQILEQRLQQHEYICGDFYSIADIAIYPWLRGWKWSKVDISQCDQIQQWLKRIRARPAVERGLSHGVKSGETDQWSKETKAQYAKMGAGIAANPQAD